MIYTLLNYAWLIVGKLGMHYEKYCVVTAFIKRNLNNS